MSIGSIWRGLKQENAAFWWLCIYIFFEYVRPQSIYTQIDVAPWSLITLALALITAFLDPSVKWVKNPENVLFLIFLSILLLSCLLAFQTSSSWAKIDIVINWMILYFLIITIVNTEKRFYIFTLLFLLVSFKMSQHGFRTFSSRGFSFADWGATGAPGWFQNSGEFAIQMVIFSPLVIAFILALKKFWGRYTKCFFYLLPITALISIVASSSRGSQVAILGVGIWFALKFKAGIKAILALTIIGMILYFLIPPEQMARLNEMGNDGTSLQRYAYWSHGINVILDHMGIGVGYANWKDYCWFVNPSGVGPLQSCQEPHNIYIQAAAELGIPGLIMFLLMTIYILVLNARTRQFSVQINNTFFRYISHGLDGGIIGYSIAAFFVTVLYYPFFWVQLAMTVALYSIAKSQFINKNRSHSLLRNEHHNY